MEHKLATIGMAVVLALGFTSGAQAQSTHGYGYFGAGGATANGYTSMMLGFGIGGEARVVPHIGVGAEIGGLGFRENFGDTIVGLFSPNGYLHLSGSKDPKIDPYVTGGYSLMFRSGHMNLFNVGGGVNVWPKEHVGFKAEIRDHVSTQYTTIHYWSIRAGITFR